jgi:pimeloyl-ACP methyl ester carboxylesterase
MVGLAIRRSTELLVLVLSCVLLASCSGASPHVPSSPTSSSGGSTQLKPFVDESNLPFEPIPGTAAKQYWGVQEGAGYRIEVPDDWNGQLLLFAHGFHGDGPELTVDDPPIRGYLVRNGFAWAASSYRRNGYAIEEGIKDTEALRDLFIERFGKPRRTYLMGASMGGHITAAAIERRPDTYDGAMPVCGALGDIELFDFLLDHAVVAAALAGVETTHPPPPSYRFQIAPAIQAALGYGPSRTLTDRGQQLAGAIKLLCGGERPLFDQAFAFWSGPDTDFDGMPFLLGRYSGPPTSVDAIVGNADTRYQLDTDAALSGAEAELNTEVLRVRPQPGAKPPFPIVSGDLPVKVVSMHTIGDLFVPFSMEQIYAREAAAHGVADRLVVRAIRAVAHCAFAAEELEVGFADLVAWVNGGPRPAGDDVLNLAKVADRQFGCRFTLVDRPGLPPCDEGPPAPLVFPAIGGSQAPNRPRIAHTLVYSGQTADRLPLR